MKRQLHILALLIFNLPLCAQIQTGVVRELNSNKKPIPGATLIFTDAKAGVSDGVGNFRLVFQGKKAGELIFMEEIRKTGYELVNEKDFEIVKISNTEQLGVDVILAKAGTVDAAKKAYYDVSDKALLAGFNRERKDLLTKVQRALISQEKYQHELEGLREQFDIQKQSLDALAEKFARVNFDDVDSLYQEALELFKAGEIEACKTKLESANLIDRTNKRLQERARINKGINDLVQQSAENEKGIKEDIEKLKLQTQTYLLTFELDKAEAIYDQLLRLDSTNLDILKETADFYREQHRYDKALAVYPKIITHPTSEPWHRANAFGHLGELYTSTGRLPDAMQAYKEAYSQYDTLSRKAPSSSFYKNNLAISYEKLGDTYTALGQLDSALIYFEDETTLFKALYEAYPQNVSFKNGLAISYSKLGETYTALGQLDSALIYYEKDLQLTKALYEAYPQNVDFKNGLAISYVKLASIYLNTDLSKGNAYLIEAEKLFSELAEDSPQHVQYQEYLMIVRQVLAELSDAKKENSPEERIIRTRINGLEIVEKQIEEATDPALKVSLQKTIVDTLEIIWESYPNNDIILHKRSAAYGSLAWFHLFNRQYAAAEQAATIGLEIDPSQQWIYSNLALGLLFQGNWEDAKKIYESLKGKTYDTQNNWDEVFLKDLDELEAAGITHPNVAKVRAYLKE